MVHFVFSFLHTMNINICSTVLINVLRQAVADLGGGGFRGFKPPPPLGCQVKI